uniref:Uncharacterized protein n=1 Tax=Rhizophora mucronata TaxID=61149 RepID=A0A2P2QLT7_RHIMU
MVNFPCLGNVTRLHVTAKQCRICDYRGFTALQLHFPESFRGFIHLLLLEEMNY